MGNALLDRCVERDMRTWCRSGFYCRWSVVPSEISQALAGAADVVFGSAPDLGWAAVAAPAAGLGFPAASCLPLRGPRWSSRRPPLASSSARRRTFGLGCSGRAGLVSTARRLTSLARPLRGAAARGGSATLRYQQCGIQKRSRLQPQLQKRGFHSHRATYLSSGRGQVPCVCCTAEVISAQSASSFLPASLRSSSPWRRRRP